MYGATVQQLPQMVYPNTFRCAQNFKNRKKKIIFLNFLNTRTRLKKGASFKNNSSTKKKFRTVQRIPELMATLMHCVSFYDKFVVPLFKTF